MTPLLVVAMLGMALVIGLLVNRWVRPFAKSEVQGVKLELLISPLLTLTVLLLAFVLVQVFTGYKVARDAEALEAGRVLFEYKLLDYYDDEIAQPAHEALICYSYAVVGQEWRHLAERPEPNPTVSLWGNALDEPLALLARENNSQPYGTLLSADKERIDGRRLRIVQARPSVPTEMQFLLLGVGAVAVLGIAAFTLPYVSRRTQAGALIVLSTALGLVMITIYDLDTRYSGAIMVEPESFEIAVDLMNAQYSERFPEAVLPCDTSGLPI